MRLTNYSIIYSGMNPDPYFAAATRSGLPLWAVASGNREGSAQTVIRAVEETAAAFSGLSPQSIETGFGQMQLNQTLLRMKAEVSLAGVLYDGTLLHMFNIGNARVLQFSKGYMHTHTEDHTEAYDAYLQSGKDGIGAYDRIRFMPNRMKLRRALGVGNDLPQFYTPFALNKDDAFLICTERFWHYISVIEMELDYRKSAGPEEWLKTMARRVLMKAGQELDEDNFAAIAAIAEE